MSEGTDSKLQRLRVCSARVVCGLKIEIDPKRNINDGIIANGFMRACLRVIGMLWFSKSAATTAAEAAAHSAHAAKSRGARTARASGRGSHYLPGTRGHLIQTIDETNGVKCGHA